MKNITLTQEELDEKIQEAYMRGYNDARTKLGALVQDEREKSMMLEKQFDELAKSAYSSSEDDQELTLESGIPVSELIEGSNASTQMLVNNLMVLGEQYNKLFDTFKQYRITSLGVRRRYYHWLIEQPRKVSKEKIMQFMRDLTVPDSQVESAAFADILLPSEKDENDLRVGDMRMSICGDPYIIYALKPNSEVEVSTLSRTHPDYTSLPPKKNRSIISQEVAKSDGLLGRTNYSNYEAIIAHLDLK